MKEAKDRWNPIGVCLLVGLLALAILPISAAVSVAQEDAQENPGFLAAKGRVTYRTYCANCHGRDGTGNGNIAEYLTIKPADLTRISENNDGEFPQEMVFKTVDGRKPVRGHGGGDMPIWGDVFQSSLAQDPASANETGEERAQRKIKELVLYLESIQAE
jgi:mono/diheme cytochrome c family protein